MVVSLCGTLSSQTLAFNNDDTQHPSVIGNLYKNGWYLEQNFHDFLQTSCTLDGLSTSDGKPLTSIPKSVLYSLGGTQPNSKVWNWVYPYPYTAANAFSIVSKDRALPIDFLHSDSLNMDPLADPETMLIAGTGSAIYSTNCTGIVAGAASVSSDIKALTVSFSAAAKADYQNSSKAELGLIRGEFFSPFLRMYQGSDGDEASLFAHLMLWDWYRKHYASSNAVFTDPLYMLHGFSGFTLYHVDKLARQADGSVSMDAKASYLGFVSGNASLSGTYQSSNSTTISDFQFAIDSVGGNAAPNLDFTQLDTVDQIVTWSGTQPLTGKINQIPGFSKVLRQGSSESTTHEQIFTGIPPSLCHSNLWALEAAAESSTFIKTLKFASDPRVIDATTTHPPGCGFTVAYEPATAVWSNPANTPIVLKYSLKSTFASKGFIIQADPISFSTSAFPRLSPPDVGPRSVSASGQNLSWTIIENVADDPTLTSPDSVQTASVLSGPTLGDCTSWNGLIDAIGQAATVNAQGNLLTLQVQQDFSAMPNMPNIQPENLTSCKVAMRLHLVMKRGKTVDLDLPEQTRLAYPKLTPTHFMLKILHQ